ncbi:hypothetical protein D3C79_1059820 [compost metagenome]
MKPSLEPVDSKNWSFLRERKAITFVISTSLNVVNIAVDCFTSSKRFAIVWRRRLIFSTVTRDSSTAATAFGAAGAFGAATGAVP